MQLKEPQRPKKRLAFVADFARVPTSISAVPQQDTLSEDGREAQQNRSSRRRLTNSCTTTYSTDAMLKSEVIVAALIDIFHMILGDR